MLIARYHNIVDWLWVMAKQMSMGNYFPLMLFPLILEDDNNAEF